MLYDAVIIFFMHNMSCLYHFKSFYFTHLFHRDLILECLDDRDESIRFRALDLIAGMISKKTLVDIVKKLMQHMEKAEGTSYRDELLNKVILICSQSNYQYVTNFEW